MKTVFESKRIKIIMPSTKAEWFATAFAIAAIASFIRGDSNTGFHMLELSFLTEISGRICND